MTDEDPVVDPVAEQARATVAAFLLRARRVAEHSLAGDPVGLYRLAIGERTGGFDPSTGAVVVIQQLPPEEQVESAAVRVRPLILQGDPTFYATFFTALSYLLWAAGTRESVMEQVKSLKKEWAKIDPRGRKIRGYGLQVSTAGSRPSEQIADTVLGFAYFYGDVVHSDADRLAETRAFGVRERFRAAVPIVANLMGLAIGTLQFTRLLHEEGLIQVDDDIFDTPVVVTDTTFREEGQVFLAPPRTGDNPVDAPPLGEELGGGWTPIHQALIPAGTPTGDSAPAGPVDAAAPPEPGGAVVEEPVQASGAAD